MPKIVIKRIPNGFIPADQQTIDFANGLKIGDVIHADFKKMRNSAYHRKYFALLNLAYDLWEPGEIDSKYGKPEKNFDRFRKDVQILAGYYHVVVRLNGETRIESDSISFAKMDQDTFEKLYQSVLSVLIKRIPAMSNAGVDDIEDTVSRMLEFA